MLEVNNIQAAYDDVKVLTDVSLKANAGEITCVMGRNGAGKTTLLRSIMGIVPISSGGITLDGNSLDRLPPHKIPKQGIGYIPQGRRLFPELTVSENIQIGLMAGSKTATTRQKMLQLFPRLEERLDQQAGTLSGGEQQMLATARALAMEPKILLLDEPTEGLQPSIIQLIHSVVEKMRDQGIAIILVEQHIELAMQLADQIIIIENGKSVDRLSPSELKDDKGKIRKYLGVS